MIIVSEVIAKCNTNTDLEFEVFIPQDACMVFLRCGSSTKQTVCKNICTV